MTISFIIPSINRHTLKRTIDSIEVWPGDEVLVEFDLPPSRKWGNPQRNKAIARAKCDYLAFIDDDDMYVPGHRAIMEAAMMENPGKPNLFRIKYPNNDIIWREKNTEPGNVSTQMILIPNQPTMLYYWQEGRNMADQLFIDRWKWTKDEIVYREEIIGHLGNPDGEGKHHD